MTKPLRACAQPGERPWRYAERLQRTYSQRLSCLRRRHPDRDREYGRVEPWNDQSGSRSLRWFPPSNLDAQYLLQRNVMYATVLLPGLPGPWHRVAALQLRLGTEHRWRFIRSDFDQVVS